MRDFKIKAEWVASLKDLPQEIRCRVIDEIIRYGTLGDEPDKSDPVTFALVKSYTDQIDKMQAYEDNILLNSYNTRVKKQDMADQVYALAMQGKRGPDIAIELGMNVKTVYSNKGWTRARSEREKLLKGEVEAPQSEPLPHYDENFEF